MKIQMKKQPGGTLTPVDDSESEKLTKFKTGELYEVDIKLSRNPAFHRKAFAFFNFCFAHWKAGKRYEFQDEAAQRVVFRKHLTCLAGYYDQFFNIKGDMRIEAKSLSFGSMEQEEFEQCYNALIQASMKHVFTDILDDQTESQLLEFFR